MSTWRASAPCSARPRRAESERSARQLRRQRRAHLQRRVAHVAALDVIDVEIREAGTERFALVEDREPAQAGLETLETELLEQAPVIGDREAPLVVVVVAVDRRRFAPSAAQQAVFGGEESACVERL